MAVEQPAPGKYASRKLMAKLAAIAVAPAAPAFLWPQSGVALLLSPFAVAVLVFLLPRALRLLAGFFAFFVALSKPPSPDPDVVEAEAGDETEAPATEADAGAAQPALSGAADPTSAASIRQTLVFGLSQMWLLAGIATIGGAVPKPSLETAPTIVAYFTVMVFALMAPAVAYGLQAIKSEKLPPRAEARPQHNHISGFGALFLIAAISGIILLAAVATGDRAINQRIHEQLGAAIVYGLVVLFLAAATVPSFGVPIWLQKFGTWWSRLLHPLGRGLSVIDSVLVYCVAPAAGVTLSRRWLGRYAYLAAYFAPLGILGYVLPAPLGLIPILWALIAAISISRRWSWVEDDRETAMLTAQFRSENLRVGFDQDLRDEALIAFTSMFVLVPLALRQIQAWGDVYALSIFDIDRPDRLDLNLWIQFFGSELAKAVPFVDWAEIYDVKGDGAIEMKSVLSRHVVFGTRVLVDLVFLATLVQVLSTFSRNAKQIDMFKKGEIDRFDPFIEGAQFQKLVTWQNGRWAENTLTFKSFGRRRKYNLTRLLELREDKQKLLAARARTGGDGDRRLPVWAICAAAEFIYGRDYKDANVVAVLYEQLRDVSGERLDRAPNKDAVDSILDELEKPNRVRQIEDLDDVRAHLRRFSTAWPLRQRLVALIARIDDDDDEDIWIVQSQALATTLSDTQRVDPRAPIRRLAFEALKNAYLRGERQAVNALQRAARSDQSQTLRNDIAKFIRDNPRTASAASWPSDLDDGTETNTRV